MAKNNIVKTYKLLEKRYLKAKMTSELAHCTRTVVLLLPSKNLNPHQNKKEIIESMSMR
jgi:hypothetical protein